MKFKTDKANSRKKSDLSKDTRRKVQSDDSDKIGLHRSVKQFLLVAFLSIGLITLIYILQIIFFDSHVHKSVDINLGPIKSEDIQQYKQILGEAENLLQDMRAKEQEPYGNPAITNKPVLATVKPDIIQPSHKAMVYDRNNRPMLRGDESHHSVSSNRGSIVLSPYSSVSVSSGNIPNSQNKPKGRRKDLVIGMAQDTDPRNLAVFCGSLREHAPDVNLVLFMNAPVPALHKEIIQKFNVIVVPYKMEARVGMDTLSGSLTLPVDKYHPSTTRWSLIYDYLKTESRYKLYNRVWMIDVRDSMFQDNPFVFTPALVKDVSGGTMDDDYKSPSFFYAFKGVESRSIEQCGWNGGWIKDCFGQQMLNKVGRNNIICSGVSVASIDIAMLYLRLMNDITLGSTATTRLNTYYDEYINLYLTAGLSNVRNTNDIASLARVPGFSNKFPGCERNGVDQGVHNVLLHNSIIPHVKLFAQGDGPVANMQAGLYKARTNEGPSRSHTIIYNSGGSKYAVAHQYDRNPAFTQNLYKRYAYWLENEHSSADVGTFDKETMKMACNKFSTQVNVDKFKGSCDLPFKSAMSVTECCFMCSSSYACHAFTYVGSNNVCYLKSCTDGNTRGKGDVVMGAVSGWEK